MKTNSGRTDSTKIVVWSARVLTVLFSAFLSIFSLDAYNKDASFWMNVFAFFMHLIPVWLILITLAVSWRFEWVGSIVFTILAILYIIWAWGRFPLSVYFVMAGPMVLIAALYYIGWHLKKNNSLSPA